MGIFFDLQVDAIRTSQFLVGNSSDMEESDKPQKVRPLRWEEAKHCIIRIGCVQQFVLRDGLLK